MAQYSVERKQAILNKLLSPELISIAQLARDEHIVSPRPHPIAEVAKHVVVAHQSGYQDVLAIVLAHLPNTHTGQDHSI